MTKPRYRWSRRAQCWVLLHLETTDWWRFRGWPLVLP